jgi:hypothetical protein
MISSFTVSIVFLILTKSNSAPSTAAQLLITIAVTTVCWLATAYLGPQNDPAVLASFYQKVRPFGPGWRRVREAAGIVEVESAAESFPMALLGWFTGCIMIWSSLFTVGNLLYGRTEYALALLAVFVVTAAILIWVIKRLWQ